MFIAFNYYSSQIFLKNSPLQQLEKPIKESSLSGYFFFLLTQQLCYFVSALFVYIKIMSNPLFYTVSNKSHHDCFFKRISFAALSPHSKKVLGSVPGQDLSMWNLHVLPMCMWVFSRYSGFPKSRDMHIRLIGDSELPLGVNVWINGVCALRWCGNLSRV